MSDRYLIILTGFIIYYNQNDQTGNFLIWFITVGFLNKMCYHG